MYYNCVQFFFMIVSERAHKHFLVFTELTYFLYRCRISRYIKKVAVFQNFLMMMTASQNELTKYLKHCPDILQIILILSKNKNNYENYTELLSSFLRRLPLIRLINNM